MDEPKTSDPDLAVSINPPEEEIAPVVSHGVLLDPDEAAALRKLLDHVDLVLAADDTGHRTPAVMKARSMFKLFPGFWKPARDRN